MQIAHRLTYRIVQVIYLLAWHCVSLTDTLKAFLYGRGSRYTLETAKPEAFRVK